MLSAQDHPRLVGGFPTRSCRWPHDDTAATRDGADTTRSRARNPHRSHYVVARGAALFAATIPLEDSRASGDTDSTALKVQLSYPAVTDDVEAPLGGLFESDGVVGLMVEIRRSDGGWISGRIPVSDGRFVSRVPLVKRQANVFEISCFDELGERLSVHPERAAITQGLAAADRRCLARSALLPSTTETMRPSFRCCGKVRAFRPRRSDRSERRVTSMPGPETWRSTSTCSRASLSAPTSTITWAGYRSTAVISTGRSVLARRWKSR